MYQDDLIHESEYINRIASYKNESEMCESHYITVHKRHTLAYSSLHVHKSKTDLGNRAWTQILNSIYKVLLVLTRRCKPLITPYEYKLATYSWNMVQNQVPLYLWSDQWGKPRSFHQIHARREISLFDEKQEVVRKFPLGEGVYGQIITDTTPQGKK